MARMQWNILTGIPMFSLAFRYIELSVKNVAFCVSVNYDFFSQKLLW